MKVVFIDKHNEVDNVWSFRFRPTEPFTWIAGQSLRLEVPGTYAPIEHRFTISSAPYEKDIVITTRLSDSAYKRSLNTLKPGDSVNAYGLDGDFTWATTEQPKVFVASGIGVTPFYSMLKQQLHESSQVPVTLVYGSSDRFIFKDSLDAWTAKHSELKIHYSIGQRVTAELVAPYIDADSLVYISGPNAMVDSLSNDLVSKYQLPPERLLRDWFTGNL